MVVVDDEPDDVVVRTVLREESIGKFQITSDQIPHCWCTEECGWLNDSRNIQGKIHLI